MKILKAVRGLGTLGIMFAAIMVFLAHGFVIRALTQDPIRRRRRLLKNIHSYSNFALSVMRVQVLKRDARVANGLAETEPRNALMVCNHMSYLDMIVLASISPSVFVTSVDMGQIFFLGTMAEIGGSLFIERRHRLQLDHDIAQIENVLKQGFDVTLFPEGTSGNGAHVLPFKRSLLTAALNSGTPVRPVTLKYFEIDGKPFGESNRDVVCWYGKQSFLPHFVRLLAADSVRAKVTLGEAVVSVAGMDKHSLCDELHRTISTEYHRGLAYV